MVSADRHFWFWETITQILRWGITALAYVPVILSGWNNYREGVSFWGWILWAAASFVWMAWLVFPFGTWVMDHYVNWLQRKLFVDSFIKNP